MLFVHLSDGYKIYTQVKFYLLNFFKKSELLIDHRVLKFYNKV